MIETVVNIVSGPLSSGKSTAILSLLERRPKDEKWAVIINESGDVGIDGASLKGMGVPVREIAGGCACCANGVVFRVALTQLVARERPVRVLLEPSGLGEASRLKAIVLATGLRLGATITLMPADAHGALIKENPLYLDQIQAADVLLVSRSDLSEDKAALIYAQDIFPPKACVSLCDRGHFALDLLDISPLQVTDPLPHLEDDETKPVVIRFDRGDGLIKHETTRLQRKFIGYILHGWKLDLDLFLRNLETSPLLERAKAFFPPETTTSSPSANKNASLLLNWSGIAPEKAQLAMVPSQTPQSHNHSIFPIRIQLIFALFSSSSSSSENSLSPQGAPPADRRLYDQAVSDFIARFESRLEHSSTCSSLTT